jgi:hypothetical protein
MDANADYQQKISLLVQEVQEIIRPRGTPLKEKDRPVKYMLDIRDFQNQLSAVAVLYVNSPKQFRKAVNHIKGSDASGNLRVDYVSGTKVE